MSAGTVSFNEVAKKRYPLSLLDTPAGHVAMAQFSLMMCGFSRPAITYRTRCTAKEILNFCLKRGKPVPLFDDLLRRAGHVAPEPA